MSTVEPENPGGLGEPDRGASEFSGSAGDVGRGGSETLESEIHSFSTSGERFTDPVGSIAEDDVRHVPESAPLSTNPRPGTRIPDPTSIAAGVVFFLLGGAYLLAASGHLTVNAAWTISLLFIGLGLSGVLGAALHDRRRRPGNGPRG